MLKLLIKIPEFIAETWYKLPNLLYLHERPNVNKFYNPAFVSKHSTYFSEPPMSQLTEEERQMKELLGFGAFHSTKGEAPLVLILW